MVAVVAVVVLITVGWFLAGGSIGVELGSVEQSGDAAATAIESRYSDLPVVAVGDLPGEARVITPGEDDRGARRIVARADGEFYYTNDHHASFREIVGVGP